MFRALFVSLVFASFIFTTFASESVPMVKLTQLEVGNFWVWDISNKEGIHSREKYTVILKDQYKVTIEMSTAYSATDSFHVHHRFEVDFRACERAHQNPRVKIEFNVKLSRFVNNEWERPISMHGRVFEEKFNCNGHVHTKNWRYRTDFKELTALDGISRNVFKQTHKLDHSDQLNGWYSAEEGQLSGILLEKTFASGDESSYVSRLSQWEVN